MLNLLLDLAQDVSRDVPASDFAYRTRSQISPARERWRLAGIQINGPKAGLLGREAGDDAPGEPALVCAFAAIQAALLDSARS